MNMDSRLSAEVEEGLEYAKDGYDVLHFNYQGLQELPQELFSGKEYAHIAQIHAKRNRLKHLPEEIELFSSLTELYLHSNSLENLPKNIGELSSLLVMDLSNNDLTSLPDTICRLHSLEVLAVSHNKITDLPKDMGKMKSLRILDMMNNRLVTLPIEVTQCPKLQRLLVDKNKLRWLPRQLCHMKHLEEVSAASNNLLCLPLDLGNASSMKTVYVDNNKPLHAMPVSIQFQEIGFNSCGSHNEVLQHCVQCSHSVTIKHKDDLIKVIYLPQEITVVGSKDNCVLPLLELATRQVHRHNKGLATDDLPLNLHDLLQGPTASCIACQRPVFTAAFPMVFEGQIRVYSLYYLGLCCSLSCVKLASILIALPVIYPDSTILSMAIALVE